MKEVKQNRINGKGKRRKAGRRKQGRKKNIDGGGKRGGERIRK